MTLGWQLSCFLAEKWRINFLTPENWRQLHGVIFLASEYWRQFLGVNILTKPN